MRSALRGAIGVAGFLLLWEAAGHAGFAPQNLFPPVSMVFARLGELLATEEFLREIIATVLAWLIALALATGIAVPLGLLLGSYPAVRRATKVLVEFIRPVPPVALIPLLIVLIGNGPETKISLAVFGALWPILFNTIYALDELEPMYVETARSFGLGRGAIMARVALPNALPFIFTGVRISASISLILVISVELRGGGTAGIGYWMLGVSQGIRQMDLVLAGTVVAGVIGLLSNYGLEWLQRRLFGWNEIAQEAR
ncbi:ABC transporter permease [Actinoalloteichus spitiensis]|uniref:ABC transporter permease n=1 Tax=Actinoalloteichus spitiensis TaxID=252394 RepID=UPI000302EC48|nr:ABC transporter permease [Actinoalloteichus spitiensis]